MANSICPEFGTGSVDLSILHDAAVKGEDLGEALARATTRNELPAAAEPAAARVAVAAAVTETKSAVGSKNLPGTGA